MQRNIVAEAQKTRDNSMYQLLDNIYISKQMLAKHKHEHNKKRLSMKHSTVKWFGLLSTV